MPAAVMPARVPFYSAMVSHDWKALGYPSQNAARFWDTRSCGVACLRMVYAHLLPGLQVLPATITEELLGDVALEFPLLEHRLNDQLAVGQVGVGLRRVPRVRRGHRMRRGRHRHGITDPAAQGQQGDHEGDEQEAHDGTEGQSLGNQA